MPQVLTHKAVLLLSRERLQTIIDVVGQAIVRRRAAGTPVLKLETKVLDLAERAHRMLSTDPPAESSLPNDLFPRPLLSKVSKYAVMGSMGPDITAFSTALVPGQQWVFDLIHKGTPDPDREMVRAPTCDFALQIWTEGSKLMTAEPDREKLRAYVLGHLCHIAADIISHPFINDIEWHDGLDKRGKLDHADGEGSHDALVAQKIYGRTSTRSGEAWDKWWPTLDEVPKPFFEAYANALSSIYKIGKTRPLGFGEFEDKHKELAPPEPDVAFVRDGYSLYRKGIISVVYEFGAGKWFGMLTFLMLPATLMPLLVIALPSGRQLLEEPKDEDERRGERAWFEVVSLPLYIGAMTSIIYGGWVASMTSRGVVGRTALGLVTSSIVALGTIAFAIEGHARGMSPAVRWSLLFGVPAALMLLYLILGFVDLGTGKERRSAVLFIHSFPMLVLLLLTLIMVLIVFVPIGEGALDEAGFWIRTALWIGLALLPWILVPIFVLRDKGVPEKPEEFSARLPHAVRLFDDATLFSGAAADGITPKFYPSGRRGLFRLWWTGEGTMSVRSDRYALVFKLEVADTTTEQAVSVPVSSTLPGEYLEFLEATVKDGSGTTGKLKGKVISEVTEDRVALPPGAAFAAHGDEDEDYSAEDQKTKSAEFRKLGTDEDSDYIVYHAPKAYQAIRFGPPLAAGMGGPLSSTFDFTTRHFDETKLVADEKTSGYLYVHDPVEGSTTNTLMSYASDVGALLCMAGATHMTDPALGIGKTFQAFRNWDLDRRRVNEWRMLVAGGALSETRGRPESYDPALPRGIHGPADPAGWVAPIHDPAHPEIVREADSTLRDQGWAELLRKWLELERQPDQNLMTAESLFPDWPTNRSLSRGLAYLLDQPEPAA
jgi:hypothetical protein